MIFQILSIYDSKAGSHLPPFFLPTIEMATRTFSDCVNEKDHAFSQHPADYTLFHHGEFDGDTAQYQLLPAVEVIGNGVDFRVATGKDQSSGFKLEIAARKKALQENPPDEIQTTQ